MKKNPWENPDNTGVDALLHELKKGTLDPDAPEDNNLDNDELHDISPAIKDAVEDAEKGGMNFD
jgi:hypothetical protein